MSTTPLDRVNALLEAAARLADSDTAVGVHARDRLVASTGLSPQGVDYALSYGLETSATDAELRSLVAEAGRCRGAHVVLSATVFTAALRAIAIALAASERVVVRPSSRDDEMARLLHEQAPELFELSTSVDAAPGDTVWAYGADATLEAIRASLPEGVEFRGHGTGIGVAVVGAGASLPDAARRLAHDVVAFDQRGCLSPRVAIVEGDAGTAEAFATSLASALEDLAATIPAGARDPGELTELAWYRATLAWVGKACNVASHDPPAVVGVTSAALLVPPSGRNVHVVGGSARSALRALSPLVTCVGVASEASRATARSACPGARVVALGQMQRPPLDGVVDRRGRPSHGE